jgi:hypothetical protein
VTKKNEFELLPTALNPIFGIEMPDEKVEIEDIIQQIDE